MLNIGPQELLLILVIALLVVGPRRLPELARSIGKGIRELRKAQDEVSRTIRVNLDETPATPPPGAERTLPRTDETTPSAEAPAEATGPGDDRPVHPTPPEGEVKEISRTLGRGLAELRRAREEIQETFRVDLEDRPAPRRPRSGSETSAEEPASE
ncbi:MAG TPA: twin-arginine translocase TatA/TatE family subunit [Actinomycetota bacterium]